MLRKRYKIYYFRAKCFTCNDFLTPGGENIKHRCPKKMEDQVSCYLVLFFKQIPQTKFSTIIKFKEMKKLLSKKYRTFPKKLVQQWVLIY